MLSLVWLRRDLRLHDHHVLHQALQYPEAVQLVFVFDTDILQQFPSPDDSRLSFIADALLNINAELTKRGGSLLVLYGRSEELIPQLAKQLCAKRVVAAKDFEPKTDRRDQQVLQKLKVIGVEMELVLDHLLVAPDAVTRAGAAYKVFTPYAKAWRAYLAAPEPYPVADDGRYAQISAIDNQLALSNGVAQLLQQIGRSYNPKPMFVAAEGQAKLSEFVNSRLRHYATNRDFMAKAGTSALSPYLRFGLLSVRECYNAAVGEEESVSWINELIWREFYAMILWHYPACAEKDFQEAYRDKIIWEKNAAHLECWQQGKTGYPIVDAAMRQLVQEGWMHNRARMIVASFLTKDLLIDWRLGEQFFALHLMDYELASNVGGWQWAASTGTDSQPYFRVFNPQLQSEKFDPNGDYIRRYVPELQSCASPFIHAPTQYYKPIVEHGMARKRAIAAFASAKNAL